jgi:hypothetical protein
MRRRDFITFVGGSAGTAEFEFGSDLNEERFQAGLRTFAKQKT